MPPGGAVILTGPKCPLSSGQHLSETFCLGGREQTTRIFIYVCIKHPWVSFLLNMVKQFPQRLKNALLFIDSSSYCKCDFLFSSGCFHYVKLVILFFYLHQGRDVFTCLFARGKKTRVMIPVKSVEGCLLCIKAEISTNRTFLSAMFFFLLHLVCHRGNDPCVWLIDWI